MTKLEYPKYVPLENGYIIVDNKEEEEKALKQEKHNEPASKNNSKGIDKKKPDADRGTSNG